MERMQSSGGRSLTDVAFFKQFPQLFFDQCVGGVGVVFPVNALRRQLLEERLHLRRSRDRDLDGIQSVFGASHLRQEWDKYGVFIG